MVKSVAALSWALAVLASSPIRAEDFCNGVKKAVVAAPTDFASLRGAPDPRDQRTYLHPFVIPGARPIFANGTACYVVHTNRWTYDCSFPTGYATKPETHTALREMVARTASCLGVAPPELDMRAPSDANPMASSALGPFRIPVVTANVTVSLGFPPDGGPGTLFLNVEKTP